MGLVIISRDVGSPPLAEKAIPGTKNETNIIKYFEKKFAKKFINPP